MTFWDWFLCVIGVLFVYATIEELVNDWKGSR